MRKNKRPSLADPDTRVIVNGNAVIMSVRCERCGQPTFDTWKINCSLDDDKDGLWECVCYPCYCQLFEMKYRPYTNQDGEIDKAFFKRD